MRYLVLLIIAAHLSANVHAQDYNYVHYTTKDGLAGSVIYKMVQDHDGFIWFGTESGLSRFDGTHFRNFTTADGLPDNEIIRLFVDSKNRVWIMPFKNSLCYYWKGTMHTAENDSLLRRLNIKHEIVSIVENAKGEMLIAQAKVIQVLKKDGSTLTIDSYNNIPFTGVTIGGLKDRNTFRFLIWTYGIGNFLYELRGNKLVQIKLYNSSESYYSDANYSMYLSPDLEISSIKRNLEFSSSVTGKKSRVAQRKEFILLNRLNDSLVAINNTSSVQIYNYRQEKIEDFVFKGINMNGTLEDYEGNLWFSTMGQGVYRLASKEFKNYRFALGNAVLPVFALNKFGDTLYAGTDHYRLWAINTKTGSLINWKLFDNPSVGRVLTIAKNEDALFVGTDVGVQRIKGNKSLNDPATVAVKSILLFQDTILIGYSHGIKVQKSRDLEQIKGIWTARITSMYKQGEQLYVGMLDGLHILNKDSSTVFLGGLHKVLAGRIVDIRGSADGTIWVATHGDGVAGYKNGKIIALLNEQNGLTSNICQALFVTDNALWVGTDKGLNKVQFLNGNYQVARYTMSDGLISDMINAIYVDKSIVYVGTPEGVSFFDEEKAFTRSMCVLKITGIRSADHAWQTDTTGLQFDHYDNTIRIEFSGISFKSGNEITYHYKLTGMNNNWQTTHDNFIEYAGLPSGNYELQLTATNKFGVQSDMVSTGFTIKKLIWEENWFRILAVLLLGALIWIMVHFRIKHIRKQETIKSDTNSKIAELEQMALKAQMNPHFIFNSLNSIQQYVIDKDIEGGNKFITDFSRLIRLTLELSTKPAITLHEEINYISTYLKLEKIRFESKFNYRVQVSGNIDVFSIYIPPMVLQPYIENSVRHGVRYRDDDDGIITVDFSVDQDCLVCVVEDNGVGRKASEKMKGAMSIEYQSKGMTLTAKRIEMMNKGHDTPIFVDVQDVSGAEGVSAGTRVIIRFPFRKTI